MTPIEASPSTSADVERSDERFGYPASFAQRRLWFLDQMEPGSTAYNIATVVRLTGPLDTAALVRGLREIVGRHEALRTTFEAMDGEPVQIVADHLALAVPVVDLFDGGGRRAEALRLASAEACRPFDLRHGPLLRALLVRSGEREHQLILTFHHIIADGWSLGVFVGELTALYAAFTRGEPSPLPELPIQYLDFAIWQREWLRGEVLESQLRYWQERLAGAPSALELPTDRPRSGRRGAAGGWLKIRLPARETEVYRALARNHGVTLFMTLLAAFQALLGRYTGQTDLVVGSPLANRNRPELEGLIGFFVNTLPLRVDLAGGPGFRELLGRVREAVSGASAHQSLPFERLVEELGAARGRGATPFFEVMLALQTAPMPGLELAGLRITLLEAPEGDAKLDLLLDLRETPQGLAGRWSYDASLFDETTIGRLDEHFRILLAAAAAEPERAITALPLLTLAERQQILEEWSGGPGEPPELDISAAFAAQVRATPEAIAVVSGIETTTYGDLARRADGLARRLACHGVGPETLVGLFAERSPELVLAMLGILKAGGAYVPLDPDWPRERLALLLDDLRPPVVLLQKRFSDRLPASRARRIVLEDLEGESATPLQQAAGAPAGPLTPDGLAYVMYTSGSSGRPKAVAVPHRAVVRLVRGAGYADFRPLQVWAQLAPPAFDASTLEIWGPLLNGGRLVVLPPALTLEEIGDELTRHGVTSLWLTAGLFHLMMKEHPYGLGPVRQLLAGGDVLSPEAVRTALGSQPGLRVINGYGPTENTTFTCCHPMTFPTQVAAPVPLGRPISGTRVYLLDPRLEPVPAGVYGELYAGGHGLARGYLGRPDLTAASFLPDPFEDAPGGRLYRTGDLARWRADGVLEFLGRADRQVKIRGFRVDPGEVEATLSEHPAVAEAAVVVQGSGDDKRLIAFVSGVAADGVEALRRSLAAKLPEPLVPSALVVLPALPLTPNGKVDRTALSGMSVAPPDDPGAAPPRTPVEAMLAGIWAAVLGLQTVGIHDDFFALGGHSLLATRLVSRVRRSCGVEVPVQALFDAPTVARFAHRVEAGLRAGTVPLPPIEPVVRDGDPPLSFAQQRLWFLDQIDPGSPAYNIPLVIELSGDLSVPALAASCQEIVARHESLRTTFGVVAGEPVQKIGPAVTHPLPVIDLTGLPAARIEAQGLMAREASRPFDLARGALLRAVVLRLSDDHHIALVSMHHIVSDGWSMGVFVRELASLYTAFGKPALPPLPLQYADYALWQRRWLTAEVQESLLAVWRQRLAGAPQALELPVDRQRSPSNRRRGATASFHATWETAAALRSLAFERGTTLFMILLAVFQVLLHRMSGQEDLVVGTPVAGRNREETEGLIGLFVNMLALRSQLAGAPRFSDLLARVRETTLEAYAHQDLPFEKLVEDLQPARDLGRAPIFQAVLALQNAPLEKLVLPGLALTLLPLASGTAKFDLLLALVERDDGIEGSLEYDAGLFDRTTADRLLERFGRLLAAFLAEPDQHIADASLLAGAERWQALAEWNDTAAPFVRDRGLHHLFAEQAQRTPDGIALVCQGERITYRDLASRADILARRLRGLGVGPEVRVGVFLRRTVDLVVAILAVLRAEGAYVPLDPAYPRERVAFLLADSEAPVVLSEEPLATLLPASGAEVVLVDRLAPEVPGLLLPPEPELAPGQAAYVIYTSGSTGRPKGVLISHASAVAMVSWAAATYPPEYLAGVLATTSICFDLSVFELFVPLATGGTILLVEDALSLLSAPPAAVATLINTVPSAITELVRAGAIPPSVRALNLAGEPLRRELADQLLAVTGIEQLWNLYGPSEDTTYSTGARVAAGSPRPPTIGRPLANGRAFVLDACLQPVPAGTPGELYLGGEGLARGYLNRPDLTAERWIPDPFAGRWNPGGERLYRTGDLVRQRLDGELEFLGRIDHQVKIRGFRIELGEIELALTACPGVREAAVLAPADRHGDRRLIAYLTMEAGGEPGFAALRKALRERLPEPFVPVSFVSLEAMPLTPNGKVDRRALAAIAPAVVEEAAAVAPRTPVEELLAGLWAEVLGRRQVGVEDDFFELGGHSLLATQLASRVREALETDLPLSWIFAAPTPAGLAALVGEGRATGRAWQASPIRRSRREGGVPLSFAQERLWFLERLQPGLAVYNMPVALRALGTLSIPALAAALASVVGRHEALRTTFSEVAGVVVQEVAPAAVTPLPEVDLGALPVLLREPESRRLAAEEASRPFDLARGPLFRAVLLRLAAEEHLLLLDLHHIVSDGWSMGVLVREISVLYTAALRGEPAPLPELPLQYADFAVGQREWLRGEALAEQIGFWRQALVDAPVLDLPTDRARPAVQSFVGGSVPFALAPELSRGLLQLARRRGATLFMGLLAGFAALLRRLTGQQDLVVGSPIAGRNRREIEALVGFFVNSLVLRLDLTANPRLSEVVDRVRRVALAAYSHQDLPFERLVEELRPDRHLSHNPLFQVMFALQNAPFGPLEAPGLALTLLAPAPASAKFDLGLTFFESGPEGELQGALDYAADLFDRTTVERFAGHLRSVLASAVADPAGRVSELTLLAAAERHQILMEWNDSQADEGPGVVELFAAVAARTPDAVALVWGEERIGYGELARRAARLAGHLRALGVGPGTAVGLCTERSPGMIAGLLGILAAGGAYVPLDPSLPPARLSFLLEDSEVPVLVTQEHLVPELPPGPARTVVLEVATLENGDAELPLARPAEARPSDLCYMIYTSGTTGRPKAVQVEHRSLAATLAATRRSFGFGPDDRMPCVAPFSFDIFLFELLSPLLSGGISHLVPLRPTLDVEALVAGLAEATALHAVPALMRQVVDTVRRLGPSGRFPNLRALFVGGDTVPAELLADLRALFPAARVWVLYGPTEGAILCSAHRVPAFPEAARPLLGRPLSNARLLVCDQDGQQVPIGVPGEIWIGGLGVTRGYWRREELTAEKYVERGDGERFFRTGDLARQLADGTLEFLGRIDHQVKVRGFRIELGEIESVLGRHPEVREVVVDARPEVANAGRRLVAYVVPADVAVAGTVAAAGAEHVSAWQALYDETYGRVAGADPAFNVEGWNNSYTGLPIPDEEMREWVGATVERVLALGGRRLLEIGCGSGLLLFRIAPHVASYRGTDFSRVALAGVQRHLDRTAELSHVTLECRTADDWSGISPGDVDLVLLNSVAQYFPGIDYLAAVLATAVRTLASSAAGGALFVGDLRCQPLLEALHLSVSLAHAPDSMPLAEMRQRVRRRVADEEELVIDPAFFFAFARTLPEIRKVEILLKRGSFHNELTRFRYDAVLHVAGEGSASPERMPQELRWLDWDAGGLSLEALADRLVTEKPAALALRGLPNARLATEAAALSLLAGAGRDLDTVGELRSAIAGSSARAGGIDPERLWETGDRLGYTVLLTWSGASEEISGGRFSAVLSRREGAAAVAAESPEVDLSRPWSAYANDPLRSKLAHRLVPELRRFVQAELPEYMVPAAFVLLAALPVTAHGKVDRRALPLPEPARSGPRREIELPRTATEKLLAGIWSELLGLDLVSLDDDFFSLGGHSLLATQVVSRLREPLGVELPVRLLFEAPTLAGLAARVDAARDLAGNGAQRSIRPVRRDGDLPLSFAQQRLWFLDQLEPGRAAYNLPIALRLSGSLDAAALATALHAIEARHESLRTTFHAADGRPAQRIGTVRRGLPAVVDLSALPSRSTETETHRLAGDETCRPFNLERGPLWRGLLLRLAAREHALLLTLHHIVSDGWSVGILVRELTTLYSAALAGRPSPLPPLPVQYADFAVWQREWLRGEVLEERLDYWRTTLVGAPPVLNLPVDRPRSALSARRGGLLPVRLQAALAAPLAALGREERATPFMTLLAVWTAFLSRLSGQDDFLVGTPIANRNLVEIEDLIGFFVNTLALRGDLSAAPPFRALVGRVREATLNAYAHQDLPFERLVEELAPERSLDHTPLFQVLFVLQNAPVGKLALPGLTLAPIELEARGAKFDLTLSLAEEGSELAGSLEFDRDLFDPVTAARLLERFSVLARAAAAEPDRPVADLSLLSPAERQQTTIEWNHTGDLAISGVDLYELVAAQARRTPEAEALVWQRERLSYGELTGRARRLAGTLRRLGVAAEDRVGICLRRSTDLVVSLLAVLAAGGAYVPLDPAYPTERLGFMVDDARMVVVITSEDLRERLPDLAAAGVRVLTLDGEGAAAGPETGDALPSVALAGNLAYLIYTSGSTGRPKGVAIEHQSAVALARWAGSVFSREEMAGVLAATSMSFDLSVFELFAPLSCGGKVVLAENALELPLLPAAAEVTLINTVPSVMSELVRMGGVPAGVRIVCLAGEPLPGALVERIYEAGTVNRVYNLYGPSEDTTYSTFAHVLAGERRPPLIGRPVDGTRAYVTDRGFQPVPAGVAGELWLGGQGLARGYLGRPELTAERFAPDPWSPLPGGRLYRTGDLARHRPDGSLEFLGRLDHQVKLRGFRIELGEVEAALRTHPGVGEAVVLVSAGGEGGHQRLVAYVVSSAEIGGGALRSYLTGILPAHMVPAAFVLLEALPLTPNGKVDRQALARLAPVPEVSGTGAPRTPLEEILAGMWTEVIGLDRRGPGPGPEDSFFALGGHSLLATQLVSRLRSALGVELPLRAIFENPTLSALGASVEGLLTGGGKRALPPLVPVSREGHIPLSYAQQRLWFLAQLDPASVAYNMPLAVRLSGRLDTAALAGAVQEVTRRHEALRTVFPAEGGEPRQEVAPLPDRMLPTVDLAALPAPQRESEAQCLVREDARQPFDLARGPVFRPRLLRLEEDRHILLASIHHIVSDGWSQGVLVRELAALYEDCRARRPSSLAALPVQYADFASWQRRWLSSEALAAEVEYWRLRLEGMPSLLDLPVERPRPAVRRAASAALPFQLSRPATDALRRLAGEQGATLYMALLAAFQVLLARISNQEDFGIGMPVAGRDRLETEGLIGFFVNTVVLRSDLAGDPDSRTLLARVRASTLEAYAHQSLPFDALVEMLAPRRSLSHTPLFQVMLGLQSALPTGGPLLLPDLVLNSLKIERSAAQFDLILSLTESDEGLAGSLEYVRDLFGEAAAGNLLDRFSLLIAGILESPGLPVSQLPFLLRSERHQLLVEWNHTETGWEQPSQLFQLFAAQAVRTPDAVAVVAEEGELSYRDLARRSARLSSRLLALGVGPEVPVGLLAERSLGMVVGILGILGAGGAYVPLDPEYPRERLAYLLADTEAPVVVAPERLGSLLPGATAIRRVFLETLDGEGGEPAPGSMPATSPDHLAYVLHTSGSTGRPKGVMVAHRAIANRILWMQATFPLAPDDAVAQKTPFTFDASIWELFLPLVVGARLVMARPGGHRDPAYLARWIQEQQVTVLQLVPTMLAPFLEEPASAGCTSLRRVFCGGEALPAALCDRLFSRLDAELCNLYGPTECAIDATYWPCSRGDARPVVPIGLPLSNLQVHLVDRGLRPVPPGTPGELCVGGVGLARGYWKRPDLTAERFIPSPFGDIAGARLYRTGDLARRLPDGVIEFLGRLDQQVKLRGLRIELGEIEAVLAAVPRVREAAVVVRGETGSQRLVAYVAGGPDCEAGGLRRHLEQRLPAYMVPAVWVLLAAMPRLPNGKVDRAALPALEPVVAEAAEPPRDEVESLLAGIWAEVLGRESVGIHDNFFALGGDSILSIQVVARANQAGCQITPRQLFEHQTVAELAAMAGHGTRVEAEQGAVTGELPLTPIQRWFLDSQPVDPHHFNQALLLRPRRPLLAATVERAVAALLRHHDALRLRFAHGPQGWRSWIAEPEGMLPWIRVDLSAVPPARRQPALEAAAAQAQAALDLRSGPLATAVWFELEDDARLLLTIHHLAVDGVSWRVILEDLETACRQLEQGGETRLPAKTTSFREWAQRLARHARSMEPEPELSWWSAQGTATVGLPVDYPKGADTEASARSVTVWLAEEETRALLQEIPGAYRARIDDLLLAALARALAGPRGALRVDLERHGREEILEDVDLSRTVGWFTSLFPVRLAAGEAGDPGRALRGIRELLGTVPRRGIGHGLLRYLRGDETVTARLRALPPAEVSYNYLGQLDAVFPAASGFALAPGAVGPARSPHARRAHPLAVSAAVFHGRLRVDWGYSAARHECATVERWAERFLGELRALMVHCLSPGAVGYAPSDFPLAHLDLEELDRALVEPGVEDLYPLAPLQEGMLFHELYEPGTGVYVEQMVCSLQGELSHGAFERAWERVVKRHPVLRTAFLWQGLDRPLQAVHASVPVAVEREDWRHLSPAEEHDRLEALLRASRTRGFDLSRPLPVRWTLIQAAGRKMWLLGSHHHIVLDGWSYAALVSELLASYQAELDGAEVELPRRRPYRDYIAWLEARDPASAEAYWRGALAGWSAPTPLPADRATAGAGGRGLAEEAGPAGIEEWARRHRLTLSTLVQAAWGLLLARASGGSDGVFGVTVSGRSADLPGIESMIGLLINTLALRVDAGGDDAVLDWLRRIQERQSEMRLHEQVPLVKVQQWSEAPRGIPLFESILVFENYPRDAALRELGAGQGIAEVRALEQSHYPLTVVAVPEPALTLRIDFDRSRFDAATATRLLRHLRSLLAGLLESGERGRVADLSLLAAAERHQLVVEWNDSAASGPPEGEVLTGFAAQAARAPEAPAVLCEGEALSYRELDRRSARLARRLAALGAGPETLVGVCLERSLDLVVSLLAVLRSGGAFLPLDPAYPQPRLAYMLEDSGARLLISEPRLSAGLSLAGVRLLTPEDEVTEDEVTEGGASAPPPPRPEGLAYVIYTSGSTGAPKGVQVEHRQLANLLRAGQRAFAWRQEDVMPCLAPFSFDIFLFELLSPLLAGGTAVLVPLHPALDLDALLALLPVATRLHAVPALMRQIVDAVQAQANGAVALGRLRTLFTGGDAVPAALLADLRETFPEADVYVLYGPTEGTILASADRVSREGEVRSRLGRPLANVELSVRDPEGRPVPVGVPGELWIGGQGVSRGYLGRDELTRERFVTLEGRRRFRTGDLARRTGDGNLEFLGRNDDQVKIRGFRVELGEIETALCLHPGVREAVVLAREGAAGERALVAWVVPRPNGAGETPPASRELLEFLTGRLPAYMVPATVVALEQLPRTANGKVDREALPTPESSPRTAEYVAPRTPTEELVARIWSELLGVQPVGALDDFFALGGHSLVATRVVSRLRRDLSLQLPIRDLFRHSTVFRLAERIDEALLEQADEDRLRELLERLEMAEGQTT
jgi:pristinamycin I synthase-3/4